MPGYTVLYRAWASVSAPLTRQGRLGLTGYVRNMPDGSVEVVAEGLGEQLERLHAWLKKGPPSAVVRRVDHRYLPYSGVYENFSVDF